MSEVQVDLKGAIEDIGLAKVVEAVGLHQLIEEVGMRRLIEEVGVHQLIEELGMPRLIEEAGLDTLLATILRNVGREALEERIRRLSEREDSFGQGQDKAPRQPL